MGVRPPSNDTEEPDAIEFGIAALDARLDAVDIAYPATADEVIAALGDQSIPYDAYGNGVALSTAIEASGREEFENEQALLNALHPVFEERRNSRGGSLVDQMCEMLPF